MLSVGCNMQLNIAFAFTENTIFFWANLAYKLKQTVKETERSSTICQMWPISMWVVSCYKQVLQL